MQTFKIRQLVIAVFAGILASSVNGYRIINESFFLSLARVGLSQFRRTDSPT